MIKNWKNLYNNHVVANKFIERADASGHLKLRKADASGHLKLRKADASGHLKLKKADAATVACGQSEGALKCDGCLWAI
ncbi:hypothetical protein NBRC116602_27550 [Hyphomicrobiales bacterium 4NK60-0047b]